MTTVNEINLRSFEMGVKDNSYALEEAQKILKEVYNRILSISEHYIDESEANRIITALWIIGTYVYKEFPSFPRLYFNAMKGSGKTRKLKLIESLAWNGKLQTNLSEAVLFRTANNCTILLDECESLSSKEKSALRELLNAGYKKGNRVQRMRKSFSREGEQQIVETFDLYGPCALANIAGLEDVLSDRAITQILEKSNNPSKINLVEDFDSNTFFQDIKRTLNLIQCSLCSVVTQKKLLHTHWNIYTQTTLTTLYTLTPLTAQTAREVEMPVNVLDGWEIELFEKIKNAGINGRSLELFFPLFLVAQMISPEVLGKTLEIAKFKVEEKKKDESIENRDIALIDFISRKESVLSFIPIIDLTNEFKLFYSDDDSDRDDLINSKWVGRALKRLALIIDKRRISKGNEVMLDVIKAQEKIKIFKKASEAAANDN